MSTNRFECGTLSFYFILFCSTHFDKVLFRRLIISRAISTLNFYCKDYFTVKIVLIEVWFFLIQGFFHVYINKYLFCVFVCVYIHIHACTSSCYFLSLSSCLCWIFVRRLIRIKRNSVFSLSLSLQFECTVCICL